MEESRLQPGTRRGASRRGFLKSVGTLPAAAAALPQGARGAGEQKLPQVRWGKHSITRLIAGSNTLGGLSHWSTMINYEMRLYFTPEQVYKTLHRCHEVGITTFEPLRDDIYKRFAAEGIEILGFARGRGDPATAKGLAARPGIIGIHHYGVQTDVLFKAGKIDTVNEYIKAVRDTGVQVGIATHIPAVVDAIESKNWDFDYWMTCVYQWGRTKAEFETLFADHKDLLPVETYSVIAREGYSEVFLSGDPAKMYKMVKQTKRPCLAYKILAAGRRCENPPSVEEAFKEAFASIKPTDAVIVGMYDKFIDQPTENAEYVRRFGSAS